MGKLKKIAIAIGVYAALLLSAWAYTTWEENAFRKLTPAQHLDLAQRESLNYAESIQTARAHLAALPKDSGEYLAGEGLRQRVEERTAALSEEAAANEPRAKEQAAARRNAIMADLEIDL